MRASLSGKAWAALLIVYVVWGSTYLAIAVVIETLPPLLAAGARWLIAGSALFAFAIRRPPSSDRPTKMHWRNAAVIGLALCLGGNGLVSVAEQRIASGMAALLVATVPLFVAAMSWVVLRNRVSRIVVLALALGFAGTAVLVRPDASGPSVDVIGALTVLAASAIWAGGSLFAGRAQLPSRPLVATGMEMICGGVGLLVVGTLAGELSRLDLARVSTSSLVALIYLIVFGSLIAFTSYVWLLRNVPDAVATTYAYVNPLVAVLLGWLIRDEQVTLTTIVGGAVIIVSVALIVTLGKPREDARRRAKRDLASEEIPA